MKIFWSMMFYYFCWWKLQEISDLELTRDDSDKTLPICWRAKTNFPIRYFQKLRPFVKPFWFLWWKKDHIFKELLVSIIYSSLSDVKKFFRPITLQIGSKWLIISRKLLIQPEDYLIISVSSFKKLKPLWLLSNLIWLYIFEFLYILIDAEQRKCVSWDIRWKQCSWWFHHYSWR